MAICSAESCCSQSAEDTRQSPFSLCVHLVASTVKKSKRLGIILIRTLKHLPSEKEIAGKNSIEAHSVVVSLPFSFVALKFSAYCC